MKKLKYIPFLIVAVSSLTLMNGKIQAAPINAANTQPSSSAMQVNGEQNTTPGQLNPMRSDTNFNTDPNTNPTSNLNSVKSDLNSNSDLNRARQDQTNLNNTNLQRSEIQHQNTQINQQKIDQNSEENQLKSDLNLKNVPQSNQSPISQPINPPKLADSNLNVNLHDDATGPDTIRSDNFDDKSVHAPYPVTDNKPAQATTIVTLAATKPELSTFVQAVKAADLESVLNGKGPFTVFAPNNAAFDKLPAGKLQELLKPENKDQLRSILLFHVIPDKAIKNTDVKSGEVATVNGKDLEVKTSGATVMVNDAKVVSTELVGSNGVIHEIDTVLVP